MQNSKESLAAGLVAAREKAKKAGELAKEGMYQALDMGYAGVGGAVAGAWIGKIQKAIENGEATEDDFKLWGVPKDLALALGSVFLSRTKFAKGKVARGLKFAGLGAFGFFTGRYANNYVLEMEDDEDED